MLAENSAHDSQAVMKNVFSLTKTQLDFLGSCHWQLSCLKATHTQIDFRKREWGKKKNPSLMALSLWKLFEICSWLCVMLRGFSEDETLLVLFFPFPSSPARFLFPPLPSLPRTQEASAEERGKLVFSFVDDSTDIWQEWPLSLLITASHS